MVRIILTEKIARYMHEREKEEITCRQMADAFVNKLYIDEYVERNKTVTQLSAEINKEIGRMIDSENFPQLEYVEGTERPKLFRWIGGLPIFRSDVEEIRPRTKTSPKKKTQTKRKNQKKEEPLYPILIEYLQERGLHAERINEKRSTKADKGKNKHRHPDVVAVQTVISNKKFHSAVKSMADNSNLEKAKLWSFEVKEKLNIGNVRESFHQTVANSVWANYAYLCAGTIEASAKEELRILTKAYGIGVIDINVDDPVKSEIYIEAKEKGVDLELCNELAKENPEFADFIQYASDVFQTGNIHKRGNRVMGA